MSSAVQKKAFRKETSSMDVELASSIKEACATTAVDIDSPHPEEIKVRGESGLPPESVYRKIVGIPTISRIRYFYQVVVVGTI